MDVATLRANAQTLQKELDWLGEVIESRFKLYFGEPLEVNEVLDIPAPELTESDSVYASIVQHYRLGIHERLVLLLALAPHLRPQMLDMFFTRNTSLDRGFTEFGGIKGNQHGGFLPTGETAAFLLSGNSLSKRLEMLHIFDPDHAFARFNILKIVHTHSDEPFLSGVLTLSPEYLSYFTTGANHKPDYSVNFPAKRLNTELEWDDLVLEDHTLEEVAEIKAWLDHGNTLMDDWGMKRKIKPGFRSLFFGPPGTGKTLTASLLGKVTGLDVYRIDLSMVVSKYIGETEKNLSNIFDQGEHKNWILFFDEADSLFGKRTQTSSSNDRYANQEVSYLLQRVEDFPGVVILATNLKANIDEAFSRRFQSMIHFPMPGPEERHKLWQKAFSSKSTFEPKLNLEEIARKYELAGGAIINVSRYCSLMALRRGDTVIREKDVITGIRKEFGKDGKTV